MLLLTTMSQFLCKQCLDFHIIFSLTEPPKTEILYVYTVCVHIQNHDAVE